MTFRNNSSPFYDQKELLKFQNLILIFEEYLNQSEIQNYLQKN